MAEDKILTPDLPPEKPPEQPPEEETEEDEEKNPIKVATKVAQGMNAKIQELKDTEARIDKKMAEFKKFIGETEVEGKTFAGQPERTKEEKEQDSAMKLLDGTGLNPFA